MQPSLDERTSTAPPLQRDASGQVDVDSVPDVIEWFLNYDQRVAVIQASFRRRSLSVETAAHPSAG